MKKIAPYLIVLGLVACGTETPAQLSAIEETPTQYLEDVTMVCVVDGDSPTAGLDVYGHSMGEGYCAFKHNALGWPICRRADPEQTCWYGSVPVCGETGALANCPTEGITRKEDCKPIPAQKSVTLVCE